MVYDDEVLQEINSNADLLEYVMSQNIDLEKRGNDYFAHCPKHKDKTPSLSFTPAKNSYYCFSCGRAGGMIGYLMDFEDMSYDEAIQKAAKIADMDMSTVCHSDTINFLKKIKSCCETKSEPYIHPIIKDSELKKYKKTDVPEWIDEGIEPKVMDLFGVMVDIRQNRIVYPVRDINGNLINVKGRTRYLDWKKLKIPKYINYFKVGVMDYFQGLNITLPYVEQKKEIIIFESIKSVMKAYGWGYKNCASAEKHTLTDEQVSLLVSLGVDIVLAYDSDVSYQNGDVRKSIDKLRRITNTYIIDDKRLLGGADAKNAPVDLGKEIWEQLYQSRKKVV